MIKFCFAESPEASHDPERLERFDSAHALADRLGDQLFAARLLQGEMEYFFLGRAGDHADAVQIAEENVAGHNPRAVDLDRHTKIDHLATRALVLGKATV